MMALAPAYPHGARAARGAAPLPVLKVLYRNTNRIQEMRRPRARGPAPGRAEPLSARPARRRGPARRRPRARTSTRPSGPSPRWPARAADEAYNDLLYAVQDNTDVHRVVLA